MADGDILSKVELLEHESLNKAFWMTALWFGVGIAIYLSLSNTIGGLANPLLASLRLSATPT